MALPRWLLSLALLGAGSCNRERPAPPGAAPAASQGPVVARVGDVDIGAAAVAAQMRRSGQDARAALDDLIRFELLGLAARQAVSPDDPDVLHAAAAAAVQRLIETDLEPHMGKTDIPDAVLQDLYDKARKAFVHPRLVDVAMLNVYTGSRMKPEPRARAAAAARALEDHLRLRTMYTLQDFQDLAADPAWKERKVQFSRVWQAIDDPFPAEVGREVQRLTHPGAVTPVISAETGFHVAIYLGERPAENVTFTQARDQLRDQIYERWRTGRFLEFAQELSGSHVIEAYPDRLAELPSAE